VGFDKIEFDKGKKIGIEIDTFGDKFYISFSGDITDIDSFQIPLDVFKEFYWYIFLKAKYRESKYSLIDIIYHIKKEFLDFKKLTQSSYFENKWLKAASDNSATINFNENNSEIRVQKYVEVKFKNKINSDSSEITLNFEECLELLKKLMIQDAGFEKYIFKFVEEYDLQIEAGKKDDINGSSGLDKYLVAIAAKRIESLKSKMGVYQKVASYFSWLKSKVRT